MKTGTFSHRICLAATAIIALVLSACATGGYNARIAEDPGFTTLRGYAEVNATDNWRDSGVHVRKGDTLVITPLYPRGYIFPVKAKISPEGTPFDTLDVDIGDVLQAEREGSLHLGIEGPQKKKGGLYESLKGVPQRGASSKTASVRTAIFTFADNDPDCIISDLERLRDLIATDIATDHFKARHATGNEVKTIDLALAILYQHRFLGEVDKENSTAALAFADKALHHFSEVDAATFAVSISRIHKLRARLFKDKGDKENFERASDLSLKAMMAASNYYHQIKWERFSFLTDMTQRERFILLTKTGFFKISNQNIKSVTSIWGFDFRCKNIAYALLARYFTETNNLVLSRSYSEKAIQTALVEGNTDHLAYAYSILGERHLSFGLIDDAERAFNKSLELSTNKIGRLESVSSRPKKTLNYNFIALSSNHGPQADGIGGSNMKNVIRNLNKFSARVGLAQISTLRNDNVIDAVSRIETIVQEMNGLSIYSHLAKLYLARLFIMQGDHDKASDLLLGVFGFAERARWKEFASERLITQKAGLELLNAHILSGDQQTALDLLEPLRGRIADAGDPTQLVLRYELLKSKALEMAGKDPTAPLVNAVACLEEIRPTATGSARDYQYWQNMLGVYDRTIASAYRKDRMEQALEIAEKARSRRFLDYLEGKRLKIRQGTGDWAAQEADFILDSLEMLEKDMVAEARKAGIKLRSAYGKGTRYTKRLEAWQKKVLDNAAMDKRFGQSVSAVPPSPQQLRQKLPADLTVLEYYVADDRVYIWAITRDGVTGASAHVSRNELRQRVAAFRNLLEPSAATLEAPEAPLRAAARELYDILVRPIGQAVGTGKVCIVPYGILNYLPFPALHDGERYLVERYALSSLPSLSVLEFMKTPAVTPEPQILALGNPDLGDAALDLPGADRELDILKKAFPSATVVKRKQASESLLKQQGKAYDILHLACHGEFVREAPLHSCMHLAGDAVEDGRLEAAEIFDLDLSADLVVTSACQTALGGIGKGDEVAGFTRAFLYAGANAVLGSLWSISDDATAVLMEAFYSGVGQQSMAASLQNAQLGLLRSEAFSHPLYWAAFTMTGGY
jgi:CHAT domain-containing protein